MAKHRWLSNADYGYITFRDKRKLKDVKFEYDIEPEIRKPSPAEREEIVLNLIREKGRCSFKIRKLAKVLFVTDRTIQILLRKLERDGHITITPFISPLLFIKDYTETQLKYYDWEARSIILKT